MSLRTYSHEARQGECLRVGDAYILLKRTGSRVRLVVKFPDGMAIGPITNADDNPFVGVRAVVSEPHPSRVSGPADRRL